MAITVPNTKKLKVMKKIFTYYYLGITLLGLFIAFSAGFIMDAFGCEIGISYLVAGLVLFGYGLWKTLGRI